MVLQKIVNNLLVLKLFHPLNGDLSFSFYDYSIYKVRKSRMTRLGQGVQGQDRVSEVWAHYPIITNLEIWVNSFSRKPIIFINFFMNVHGSEISRPRFWEIIFLFESSAISWGIRWNSKFRRTIQVMLIILITFKKKNNN